MTTTMRHLALLPLLLLASCSMFGLSDKTSPVMQIGKDSFNVRASSAASISDAKLKALSAGNDYCKDKGNKSVMLVNEFSGTDSDTGQRFYDLTFMCLSQGDADFKRITRETFAAPAAPVQE